MFADIVQQGADPQLMQDGLILHTQPPGQGHRERADIDRVGVGVIIKRRNLQHVDKRLAAAENVIDGMSHHFFGPADIFADPRVFKDFLDQVLGGIVDNLGLAGFREAVIGNNLVQR